MKLIKIRRNVLLFALLFVTLSCSNKKSIQYDILIEKATVINGTGSEPYVANVLIKGDSIALIDKDTTSSYPADDTINARGLVLTPGFIDTHAHGDPLKTPDFKNFLSMGVTTICLGQDGSSPGQKNLNDWMGVVSKAQPGVNIVPFVGHGTLRMLSGIEYDTLPSGEALAAMEKLLQEAMEAGCFGMTTGLEYTPGYYAGSEELIRLAKIVGDNNGMIMSHIRNEDNHRVETSIRELLSQGKYCPVHVSHIKVVYGKGKERGKEILALLDSARNSGITITADLYPYTASYTGIAILFPEWAKKPYDYQEVLKNRRQELGKLLRNKVMRRNGPEATLLGSGKFKGKTLEQVAEELQKPFEEVLMDDIGPYGASGAYFVMDKSLQEAFLTDPHIMICTDGSPTINHPRGYGSFAKVIETYAVQENLLTLADAIWKMSGLSAETIGLKNRGLIKTGYKADVLIFDPEEIRANATYENPHQLSTGFQYVIVNGKIVKEGEDFNNKKMGQMLKKE